MNTSWKRTRSPFRRAIPASSWYKNSITIKSKKTAYPGPGEATSAELSNEKKQKFDEQARALDASSGALLEGIPYFVEMADGKTYTGYTDSEGKIPRIFTKDGQEFTVYWFDEALAKTGGI